MVRILRDLAKDVYGSIAAVKVPPSHRPVPRRPF
jgi:hypothetical protein